MIYRFKAPCPCRSVRPVQPSYEEFVIKMLSRCYRHYRLYLTSVCCLFYQAAQLSSRCSQFIISFLRQQMQVRRSRALELFVNSQIHAHQNQDASVCLAHCYGANLICILDLYEVDLKKGYVLFTPLLCKVKIFIHQFFQSFIVPDLEIPNKSIDSGIATDLYPSNQVVNPVWVRRDVLPSVHFCVHFLRI